MKEKKGFLFLVAVVIFLFMVRDAFCISFLDEKIEITGNISNESAWRLADGEVGMHGPDPAVGPQKGLEAGDYVLGRNQLQIETKLNFRPDLTLYGIWRGFYDTSIDWNGDYEDNMIAAGASHRISSFEKKSELRELYADWDIGNWHARVGKQQIVWGESDLLRMADIINPLDMSWHYVLPVSGWEDIRIPMWAIDLSYAFPASPHGYTIELVYLPGAFDNGWQPTKLAPAGANWAPIGYPQYMLDDIRDSIPGRSISSNSSFGGRLKARFGDWDLSLFDYYSREDLPVFEEDWLPTLFGGGTRLFQYKYANKIGATFNVDVNKLKTVFRGECAYTMDAPFNPVPSLYGTLPGFRTPIFEKDTFAYMLGFDRPTMIDWLNLGRSFFISMQIFQKYILDSTGELFTGFDQDSSMTQITLIVNTGYWNDTLLPGVAVAVNPDGETLVQPQIEYIYKTNWRFTIGSNIFGGTNKSKPYWGTMRDNDEIYTKIKFSF